MTRSDAPDVHPPGSSLDDAAGQLAAAFGFVDRKQRGVQIIWTLASIGAIALLASVQAEFYSTRVVVEFVAVPTTIVSWACSEQVASRFSAPPRE